MQPGARILFEADIEDPDADWDVEWQIDGERVRYDAHYDARTQDYYQYVEQYGATYFTETFDSSGTYEVTAYVFYDPDTENRDDPDYDQADVIQWEVHVTSDGTTPPSVDSADPDPGETLAVGRNEPFEIDVDVSSPDSDLDRTVWWLSQADVVLEFGDPDGNDATLEVDGGAGCHTCAITSWLITEDNLLARPEPWVLNHEEDVPATFRVAEMQTNSPIGGGETLEVTATIHNIGDETGTTDVDLVVGHDPEIEDSQMLTLDPGESTEITLLFEAGDPAGEVEEFPVVVDTGADTASEMVAVESDGPTPATFNVMDMTTNSPVGGGETLEVDTTIENVGDETGTTDIELVVGHDPVVEDSEMLTLEAGESADLTLTFQAGQPAGDTEEFPVEVDTGADTASEMVVVESDGGTTPATFNVMGMSTNSPIGGGETLEVDTTIENVGDETGTTDVDLVVGHDPEIEDSQMLTLDPGESADLTLTFQAGQPAGDTEEFPVVVDTGADTASEMVVVEADETVPATFNVMSISTNSPVGGGEILEVDTTIENVGDETGTTDVVLIVGHDPAVEDSEMLTLEAGESASLTLTFQAGQPAGDTEEFPVEVDTGADSDAVMVVVEQ
ncbi:hypothetical protein [Natronorubrum sp. FCH18a]|uniref:hypothetical protein n=1 Tax=Natronorubrum sp. FCH18a TaxID=3447018 RepID=UPI003F5190B9